MPFDFYVYVCKYLDAKGDGIMDKTIDDLFILKLIKAGDRLAFKHLFELYFTPLCRFVHLYMKKPGAAEDIVVDIFASFWERRGDLTNPDHVEKPIYSSPHGIGP